MAASLLPCFRIPLFLWHRLSCWFLYQSIAVQSSLCRQWQWHPTGCNSSPRRNTCLWEAWHCGISEEWWYAHRLSAPHFIPERNGTASPDFSRSCRLFSIFSDSAIFRISLARFASRSIAAKHFSPSSAGKWHPMYFFPHSLSHDSISLRCPSRWCFHPPTIGVSNSNCHDHHRGDRHIPMENQPYADRQYSIGRKHCNQKSPHRTCGHKYSRRSGSVCLHTDFLYGCNTCDRLSTSPHPRNASPQVFPCMTAGCKDLYNQTCRSVSARSGNCFSWISWTGNTLPSL